MSKETNSKEVENILDKYQLPSFLQGAEDGTKKATPQNIDEYMHGLGI